MSITKRDDKGRILPGGKAIDSETGRAMSKKRWEMQHNNNVIALLEQAGYTVDNAPPHLKLLAEKAVVSGGGSVSALVQFVKEIRTDKPIGDNDKQEKQFEPCPIRGPDGSCVFLSSDRLQAMVASIETMPEVLENDKG